MQYQELIENMDPLLPMDFFSCTLEVPYVKNFEEKKPKISFCLPDTSELLNEESFCEVAFGWNEKGIMGIVPVQKPFEHSSFPDYENGDSFELFVDTRDNKAAGFASRFCHHFVFLANENNGIRAQEMTKFRSDDSHPLCEAEDLHLEVELEKKKYSLKFFIPTHALHGYDPSVFSRIGLTYKVNRFKNEPQHFTVSSKYFDILQHPSLWASLKLVK
jgi:hypothetical protein